MRRREFVAMMGALATPHALAQQPGRRYRVGILLAGSPTPEILKTTLEPFRQGMRERGWIEGENYVIDARWAEGRPERHPELARDLVASNADVLLAAFTQTIRTLTEATKSIPIVMVAPPDPVGSGLVASLARPGGNVTGLAFDVDFAAYLKQASFLRQIVPNLDSVAVFINPAMRTPGTEKLAAAVAAAGVKAPLAGARSPDEIEPEFARMQKQGVRAAIVIVDGMLIFNASRITELGVKYRIALGSQWHGMPRAGALLCYGPEVEDNYRRSAYYVDKILRGAKPADLPVELPSRIKLTVNLKTAKALGLKVPQSVLVVADEVIE